MNPILTGSLIGGYLLILLFVSWITGRKADNATFFLGNRQSPWFIVAIGMVGASLSGVTFVSVPGWVATQQFNYLQMVTGFVAGYIFIANILLPLYYRLNLTSIYTYLNNRFGTHSYKSGSILFIISKLTGASARLYLMAGVLQLAISDPLNIPFYQTVMVTIGLIWLYTFKGGIKTIIWTDALQTLLMLSAVGITIYYIGSELGLGFREMVYTISKSEYSTILNTDWASSRHFLKQFFSGAFITIVMTGLDQDMMQKNLSCKNIRDAKKNMYWYGIAFLPVNLLFLSLGALLYIYINEAGIPLPDRADDLYPMLAMGGYLPMAAGLFFILGLVAAAYSSADSALASLTTVFSLDILKIDAMQPKKAKTYRVLVHFGFTIITALIILIFRALNQDSIINLVYVLAGYTYGPLLGLYAFGLFTKYRIKDKLVVFAAILPPVITGIIDFNAEKWFGFSLGYEKLILNGFLTFVILWLIRIVETGKTNA
ncbi:sodium:solute symporter [Natronoflexus pectinivorans]|uniref:SSS family transporter n=1 Tax=Natronoflexus pectinivorans TaxID=682526 RepID=A0A4R2GL48_9BACT|nr:sodium:solute symporter [Natronoflexus pectinivorans]TCO09623.1 SSS family transporter [Natronoflexus pectinivorans]